MVQEVEEADIPPLGSSRLEPYLRMVQQKMDVAVATAVNPSFDPSACVFCKIGKPSSAISDDTRSNPDVSLDASFDMNQELLVDHLVFTKKLLSSVSNTINKFDSAELLQAVVQGGETVEEASKMVEEGLTIDEWVQGFEDEGEEDELLGDAWWSDDSEVEDDTSEGNEE